VNCGDESPLCRLTVGDQDGLALTRTKEGRVKLIDFGIARQVRGVVNQDSTEASDSTISGKVVGTIS
jgi:hypothetical protein